MSAEDEYTDNYVSELLKKDAKATSSAAMNAGLGSLLSKRPTGAAPKPNTRFLKNLIRDTDSHNAALLAKEAEESRARLRKLHEEKKLPKWRPEQQLYSARGRHDGITKGKPDQQLYSARIRRDDAAVRPEQQLYSARSRHEGTSGPPTKKRRLSHDSDDKSRKRSRRQDEKDTMSSSRHDREDRKQHKEQGDDDDDDGFRIKGRSKRSRSRSRSPNSDEDRHHTSSRKHESQSHSHTHRRRRTRSPRRDHDQNDHSYRSRHHHSRTDSRSRSPSRDRASHEKRHHRRNHSASPEPLDRRKSSRRHDPPRRAKSPASDSDPLEEFLGPLPLPPVRSKGRGAFNRSAIDSHFAENYDPSADVTPDVEEDTISDDWENALEALRDRQKWRTQGAERLRAAGFSEEHIEKWQNQKVDAKGDRVMDEADVKWSKKGEGREWDRGKVVDEESGTVDVKPEWGRLKGT